MGTRGFIAFVIDGTAKVAYNHWDSYPGGLGTDVLTWLRSAPVDAETVRRLRVVTSETPPQAADIERLRRFADTDVATKELTDWYVLLRGTQGNPALILEAGVIEDASHFPADSLFAEWGYVIDLDAQAFEVYQGFQQAPHSKGRFASPEGKNGYYPVALRATWPLDGLPDDAAFTAATEDPDEEG